MIPEIGHFCLIVAMMASACQVILLFLRSGAPTLSVIQFLCISTSLAALIFSYASSDFSLLNVAENSHSLKPMLFKITGTWGNHEGSILLWLWVLSLFGYMLTRKVPGEHRKLRDTTLGVQAILCFGIAAFILFTSNPFTRIFPPPVNGNDLNPILQDIGLAIHPPMLYLGYVGFSIVFSFAVASLLNGKVDKDWARIVHAWILLSWSFLTFGIALGSWWAYRELGWGGYWFWDPVENASLLTWMTGTALLHSNIVLMKRGLLKRWVIILAIITFSMSMIGTFLVRSGAITSVHSFASDPGRGVFILAYLTVVTGGALALYAIRAPGIRSFHRVLPISREGMIVINNLFMLTSAATILLATLYPMGMEVFQLPPVTIGAVYFNVTILPLLAIALLFAAMAPFLAWQRTSFADAMNSLQAIAIAAAAGFLITLALADKSALLASFGVALSIWLGGATLKKWSSQTITGRQSASFLTRMRTVPLSVHGMALAHFGAAIVVLAVTVSTLWKHEHEQVIKPGEQFAIAGATVQLEKAIPAKNSNYTAELFTFSIKEGGKAFNLTPEIRQYGVREMSTSEAAIDSGLLRDFYLVTGKTMDGQATTVRAYVNPFMNILWTGCLLMVLGGMLSMRRANPTKTGI